MNERIKKLIELAGISVREYYDETGSTPLELQKFAREFAELIVRECVAICQDIDGEEDAMARCGRQDCVAEIKEHFGVEE